jgi:hypothetical protein
MILSKNIKTQFAHSTVVNNYRYFYYLANELLSMAQNNKDTINQFRYSMAVVIFSYSAIENFILYSIYEPRGKVSNYFENMSNDLKQKLDRLPIMERLELLFHFKDNVNESFNRGKEPLQSFNLLRQLRNFLIHYKPFTEVVFSSIDEIQAEETKLEKMLKGKFEFNHDESAFVYKCITQDCAKWAFELIDDFYDWYCEELEIPRHNLKKHWEIK